MFSSDQHVKSSNPPLSLSLSVLICFMERAQKQTNSRRREFKLQETHTNDYHTHIHTNIHLLLQQNNKSVPLSSHHPALRNKRPAHISACYQHFYTTLHCCNAFPSTKQDKVAYSVSQSICKLVNV